MITNRWLALAGYVICLFLGFGPLLETALALFPFIPGEVAWRYGATGLFTRALMTPLLALGLAVALALYLGHRRMVRALAVTAAAGALLTLIVLPLFLLDAVQMRGQVNEGAELAFDVATVAAVLKMLVTMAVGVAVAVGGWQVSRPPKAAPAEVAPADRMIFRSARRPAEEALTPSPEPEP